MAAATLMGATVKRKEDPRLIRGAGAYVADLKLPGMLYLALVRSPYAHARIRGIDVSAAGAMPGVVTVVTGRDMLAVCEPLPLASSGEGSEGGGETYAGRVRHVLAVERARHAGEAVAAVVAASYATALDAAQAIEVDYEPLPVVSDPLQALAPDAPLVFAGLQDNVDHRRRRQKGNVEAAFAAAHVVVRQRMRNQRLAGFPLEGRAVLAAPDPATGGLTLYSSTQTPHQVRSEVATVLRLSENQVRVIAPDVGGGFGVKIGSYPEEHLCAALARRLNAPVRWVETRLEHMQATTHGRAQICDLEVAAADGTITALRTRIVADLGAYPLAPGLPDLTTAMMLDAAPEEIELCERCYRVRGAPHRAVSLAQIATRAYSRKLPAEIDCGLEATEYFRPPDLIYPFGAHVAVVEVDPETGETRLRDYVAVDDCGPRISPLIVTGQIHGGLAQGIAQALLEEVVYDANGQLLSGSPMDYAVPRADFFPPFTLDQTETPTPLNPLGVKGVGEAATIGSTPAVVNAVIDALAHLGVRHLDMPLRPEKVWRAMRGE